MWQKQYLNLQRSYFPDSYLSEYRWGLNIRITVGMSMLKTNGRDLEATELQSRYKGFEIRLLWKEVLLQCFLLWGCASHIVACRVFGCWSCWERPVGGTLNEGRKRKGAINFALLLNFPSLSHHPFQQTFGGHSPWFQFTHFRGQKRRHLQAY
jgi:hypothetical protein